MKTISIVLFLIISLGASVCHATVDDPTQDAASVLQEERHKVAQDEFLPQVPVQETAPQEALVAFGNPFQFTSGCDLRPFVSGTCYDHGWSGVILLLWVFCYAMLWGYSMQPNSGVFRTVFAKGALFGSAIALIDSVYYLNLCQLIPYDYKMLVCPPIDLCFWLGVEVLERLYACSFVYLYNWEFSLMVAAHEVVDEMGTLRNMCYLLLYIAIWANIKALENPVAIVAARWVYVTLWSIGEKVLENYAQPLPHLAESGTGTFQNEVGDSAVARIKENGVDTWIVNYHNDRCVVMDSKLMNRPLHAVEKYVECAAHIPCVLMAPLKVLVIGDAEGLYTQYVIKHACVEKVTVLEPVPKAAQHIREQYLRQFNHDQDARIEVQAAPGKLASAITALGASGSMFDLVILSQRLVNATDDDVMAAASLVSPKGMLVAHMHETECTPAMPLPSRIATLRSNFKDRLAWMEPFCALFPLGGVGVIFGGVQCPRISEADAERVSATLRERSIESKHLDTPSKAAALLHKPKVWEAMLNGEILKRSTCTELPCMRTLVQDHGSMALPWSDFQGMEATKMVVSVESEWQKVEVADTVRFGRALFTEHSLQSAACDELIYHEGLVHVPAAIKGNVKRVLIGGAGEGATLRELLRWPGIEEIVTVDIDEEGVLAWEDPLWDWNLGLFRHPKVKLTFDDINNVIKNEAYHGYFDLVISDLSDPQAAGPVAHLFTRQYFENIRRCMKPDALMVMQSGEFDTQLSTNRCINSTMATVWPHVRHYCVDVPSFQGTWLFMLTSDQPIDIIPNDLEARVSTIKPTVEYRPEGDKSGPFLSRRQPLQFYSPACHRALFEVFSEVDKEHMETPGPIIDAHVQKMCNLLEVWQMPAETSSDIEQAGKSVQEAAQEFVTNFAVKHGEYVLACASHFFNLGHLRELHSFCVQKEADNRGTFLFKRDFVTFLEEYEHSMNSKLVSVHKGTNLVGAFELKTLDVANAFFVSASASDVEVSNLLSEVIDAEVAADKTLLVRSDANQAASAFKLRDIVYSHIQVNGNTSPQRFASIWELVKRDAHQCIMAGIPAVLPLVFTHKVKDTPLLPGFSLVDTLWFAPPIIGSNEFMNTNVGLAVKTSMLPKSKVLSKYHIKMLYIAMWEQHADYNYIAYPAFKHGLEAIDRYFGNKYIVNMCEKDDKHPSSSSLCGGMLIPQFMARPAINLAARLQFACTGKSTETFGDIFSVPTLSFGDFAGCMDESPHQDHLDDVDESTPLTTTANNRN